MPNQFETPEKLRDRRLINSSPILSRHEGSHSDSDSEGDGVIEQIEKRMKARNEKLYKPMSSPIRGERSSKGGFQSRSLGAKYTLRGRNYIPFNQQKRDERRAKIALEKRGGNEEMERFIQTQEDRAGLDKLNQEASSHMFDIEELNEDDPDVLSNSREPSQQPLDAYEKELEDMIRMEQEELEMLTANLNLDS